MRAALGSDHPSQRRVHPFGIDKLVPAAPGQKLAQRLQFQLLGVYSLTQEVDALLQNGTQTGTASSLDQRPGEGMLLVGERDRGFHCHVRLLGVNAIRSQRMCSSAASTRAAQYLNSGIFPNGSSAGLVSVFAAASA